MIALFKYSSGLKKPIKIIHRNVEYIRKEGLANIARCNDCGYEWREHVNSAICHEHVDEKYLIGYDGCMDHKIAE